MLGFIQNKEWSDQKQLLKEPKYNDAAFIAFISPYCSESYNTLIINYLADSNVKNLVAVLNIKPSLLTENDQAMGWFSVEAFLEDWQDNLNEIVENMANGEGYSDKELELYTGKQFIECLNLLPFDFKIFRDNYAESLYNLSGSSWNNEQYYRAINILKNAQLLDVFEETQQMLAERRQLYKKDGHQSGYSSIFTIIIFIFLMIQAAGTMLNSPTNVVYSDERFIEQAAERKKATSKERFEGIISLVKSSSGTEDVKKRLIQSSLDELERIRTLSSDERAITPNGIDSLVQEFKVLQKEQQLE